MPLNEQAALHSGLAISSSATVIAHRSPDTQKRGYTLLPPECVCSHIHTFAASITFLLLW